MSRFLEVEVVKLRNLPQTEDDPDPCTSQVRMCFWNDDFTEAICTEQNSSVQTKSNMPYFKDAMRIALDDDRETGVLAFTVWEFSRRDDPYILFYGRQAVSYEKHKHRKELTIMLTTANPDEKPQEAAAEEQSAAELGDKAPTLTIKVLMPKKKEEQLDKYADVEIENPESINFAGARNIIPADACYIWMRFLMDKKFLEGYRKKLLNDWSTRPPIEAPESPPAPKRRKSTSRRPTLKGPVVVEDAGGASKDLKNIGDVIVKRWCCHRPHQVLTRLRLTGEKYFTSSDQELIFSPEEELAFRIAKKERAVITTRMCMESLYKSGANVIRDWMERLWTLYAVGVDNDPAGNRTLSYELRKKVMESTFDIEDSIVLQASLLNLFMPALTFEKCQGMVEDDARNSPDITIDQSEGWEQKVTVHQRYFTLILSEFMGALLDTLTEAELARMCKAIKPAVFDAQQRVLKNAKTGIRGRVREMDKDGNFVPHHVGSGIKIDHLDKYGNRKKSTMFA